MRFDNHLTITERYNDLTSMTVSYGVLRGMLVLTKTEVKEPVTSSGRKVPKRNPKAKAWVSPYGGKRK